MSYTRPIRYAPGQSLRSCDICGFTYKFPADFLPRSSDGFYRCKKTCAPKGSGTMLDEVVVDRERAIAQSRAFLKQHPPAPGAMEVQFADAFTEEGTFLDFICETAPDAGRIPHGCIAPLPRAPSDSGQALIYLSGLIGDTTRSPALVTRALAKVPVLGDYLLSVQRGFGDTPSAAAETDKFYGSFANSTGLRFAVETADGGFGLLLAYQLTGAEKYLRGARAAAHHLRTMQSAAFTTALFTSKDAAGTQPLYLGAFCRSQDASGVFDGRFQTNGWWPLWFLSELKKVTGDISLGAVGTVGGFFAEGISALLSQVIADARAFWATGYPDFGTTASITGLSVATPRQEFRAFPFGDSTWWYSSGNATSGAAVEAAQLARSMWAMAMVDGVAAPVATALWAYLRTFMDDGTFATAAAATDQDVADGLSGTYDATLAPTTLLNVRTGKIASSLYDWRAAGMLAPLSSSLDSASFKNLKQTLGQVRNRAGIVTPTAAEPTVSLYLTSSAPVGNIYRYAPKQTRTFDEQAS